MDSHIPMKRARVRRKTFPMYYTRYSGPNEGEELFAHQGKEEQEDWDNFRRLINRMTWCIRKAKPQHFKSLSNQTVGNPRKVLRELNIGFWDMGARKRSVL